MTGDGVKKEVGGERCGTHIRPSLLFAHTL